MYCCHQKRVSRTHQQRTVIMMLDGECKFARQDAKRRADAQAMSVTVEAQSAPTKRGDMMLKLLSRDDALRASYLRRRWQGLTW